MESIKSRYIIQIVSFFLSKKRKLKLVKYNKNFQNIFDLNINDYIKFSGRYIIYDKKGKNQGKEKEKNI